jgi:hypothetical protein
MRLSRIAVALTVLAVAFVLPAVVHADRKATSKEGSQIAAAVQLPAKCARVRVSTETKKPKWGSVSWRNGGSECEPLASDGVTVEKKSHGRWRFVTAGSSFDCTGLYAKVPQNVARDLHISCT